MTIREFFDLVADRAQRFGLRLDDHSVIWGPVGAVIIGVRCDFADPTTRGRCWIEFDAELLDMADEHERAVQEVVDDEIEAWAIRLRARAG